MSIDKSNILIVDDNKDHQILMEEALEQFIQEANLVFVGTGEECLLKLSKEDYEAVVIDFNLSDMDGLEVLRSMNYKEYNIPAIMVTAFGDENIAVEAMKLGALDYIVKSTGYLKRLSSIVLRVIQEPKLKKEKEKVENDLRASELKYKTLIDNMIDVVFTADKELNIISINLAGQRVFEYSCEEIKGLNFYDLIHDADKEKIIDCIKGSFAGNREFLEGFEFRIKTGNGRRKDVQLNAKVDYDNDDNVIGFEGVVRDITGRKEFEQKLFQIDKLNALGLQSSGVAHEFNNILGIILGYLEIVKDDMEGVSEKAVDALRIIEKAARDGSVIVDKIQQFSRIKKEHEKKEEFIDLIDVVNDALEFTMPRWKTEAQSKGIEYEIINNNFAASKCRIRCNPSELREVIINIINNSIDAMPIGGKIEVSIKTGENNVIISISDNGIGIKDDIKDKIFDPFFSTKGVKRSGLGMSLSYSIMARHGGEILVDSCVGKGTTMHLKMPLFDDEIESSGDEETGIITSHNADILIIEDEDVILDMMKILLESRGHNVFVSQDSSVGIEMYENNQYDIVLCDLAMPKLNGWQVAKFIKEYDTVRKRTKTPVVLITGYELDADNIDYKKEGVDFILNKPIVFDALYKIINNYSAAKLQKGS
ncbi:MAG: response regulator [Candidatus Scalindua rubra]|uniref:histidine kinase n=1 Tax=Candidatus Scalindua brodae TaxID=237368 RepID=A0A0B0EKL9_9BACT|nr:MAG: two component sensor histidine kinase [Candidatus Scalindua brodae]MBZ0110075.1 response regulator [Candidatus Scalindua rubra]